MMDKMVEHEHQNCCDITKWDLTKLSEVKDLQWKVQHLIELNKVIKEDRVLAQESAIRPILNSDEWLQLQIQINLCYRYLKNYEKAMLVLSNVVNTQISSQERLETMYLRSETYKLQNKLGVIK